MTDESAYYNVGLGGGRNTLKAKRFWDSAQEERLIVQRCGECREFVFPPQDLCPYCWAEEPAWEEVSGNGSVSTYSTIYVGLNDDWEGHLPYTVAFIELEEDVFLFSNIIKCTPEEITLGMPVEVEFNELPGTDILFPQFRPREE